MSRAEEVYYYSRSIDKELSKLKSGLLGAENSRILLEFYEQLVAESISPAKRLKYLMTLRTTAIMLGKPFPEVTKGDIVGFVSTIEQRDYSEWTKQGYKVLFKRFFKWFKGCEDGFPPEVRWIRTTGSI